jgi:hypothetical protein
MALGVKMNILLFLPGLLVLLFQYQGVIHGTICIALIAIVQVNFSLTCRSLSDTDYKLYWV